jgi:hypothetical protein
MIDREHKLSVARQAKLLGFSRGRTLESQPWRIMSIGRREWANGF